MTDEQVVRTLAEFMGVWPADATGEPFSYGSGTWAVAVPLTGTHNIARHLPAYLTSYDALAPVWRKVMAHSVEGEAATRNFVTTQADGDGEWLSRHTNWFRTCWMTTPRDHAYALAQAIRETQQ